MNYIDYIIITVVAFFAIRGLFKGFLNEVFGFLGLILALIFATKYMSNMAGVIDKFLNIPPGLTTLLGYLIIFVGTIFAVQLLNHVLQKAVQVSFLNWVDKTGGGLVGFIKGGIIISLLLLLISIIPFSRSMIPGVKDSTLYAPTKNFAPKIFNYIMYVIPNSKSFYGELKETFDKFSVSKLGENTRGLLESLKKSENSQDSSNGK
ncbi:CvpA family protein [candidate division KSB1 bacterium]|nr:CvpA family protein [candidate division KSB1 bacterium]